MAAERALGHEPRDVSAAKVGYDVESREAKTGRLRFIEVKGRAGDADTVTVTHQEIRTALNKPDAFILAIVRVRDGYVSGPHYPRRPFRAEPDFDADATSSCASISPPSTTSWRPWRSASRAIVTSGSGVRWSATRTCSPTRYADTSSRVPPST